MKALREQRNTKSVIDFERHHEQGICQYRGSRHALLIFFSSHFFYFFLFSSALLCQGLVVWPSNVHGKQQEG